MAQSKLETQIKEQLNAREIKPTEMAWDRLDAMLSVSEKKKVRKGFGWMKIAAIFIVLFVAGFVLYQLNSKEIQIENQVVNQEESSDKVKKGIEIQNEIAVPNSEIVSPSTQVAEVNSIINQKTIITKEQGSNWRSNQKTNQKTNLNENEVLGKQEIIVENSLQKEVKMEPNIKIVPISVSPEKLLASVETNKKEKSTKSNVNVNAKSLLAQAEGEHNQNFRETRFQKLKRNFKTVKTAVSNRNNQE